MNHRNFPVETEAAAGEWHSKVLSDHQWVPDATLGRPGGIGEGYYVTAGSLTAFAKPAVHPKPEWHAALKNNIPATHEKIAADLAYELCMPVPPALLWHCPSTRKESVQFKAVSLVPFKPFYTWEQILLISGMVKLVVPGIAKAASEIVAFDTWLDNRDRVNAGNVIVGMQPGSTDVRCAYLDFAQSMSFSWDTGEAIPVAAVPRFPGAVPADRESLEAAVRAIESLDDAKIRAIVERIPEKFTTRKRLACIVNGLLMRRGALRGALLNENRKSP